MMIGMDLQVHPHLSLEAKCLVVAIIILNAILLLTAQEQSFSIDVLCLKLAGLQYEPDCSIVVYAHRTSTAME